MTIVVSSACAESLSPSWVGWVDSCARWCAGLVDFVHWFDLSFVEPLVWVLVRVAWIGFVGWFDLDWLG